MKYFIQTPMKKNILIWGIAVGELEGTLLLKHFTMGKVARKPGANLENQDSNPGTLEYNAVMLANKPMRSLVATLQISNVGKNVAKKNKLIQNRINISELCLNLFFVTVSKGYSNGKILKIKTVYILLTTYII